MKTYSLLNLKHLERKQLVFKNMLYDMIYVNVGKERYKNMRFPEIKDMNIAIYLRKSRADREMENRNAIFKEVEDTLKKHRRELLEFADDHRLTIVDEFKEVVSGEHLYDRTEMLKLMQGMEKDKYHGVLVIDLDRLTRGSKVDQGLIENAFRNTNTLIITPHKVYDMNNESDSFTVGFKTYMSHLELTETVKRLQMGRVRSTRDGRDMSPKPPYGYIKDINKILTPNYQEAHIVQEIFERFVVDQETPKEIAKDLTEREVPSPSGGDTWHVVSVHHILRREKYTGTQVFGKTQSVRNEEGRYVPKKILNEQRSVKSAGTHEALIDKETFIKAQLLLGVNNKRQLDLKSTNPFKDVLVCSECGKAIYVHRKKSRGASYFCRNDECETGQISEKKLMKRFAEEVLDKLEYIETMKELTGKDADKLREKILNLVQIFESDAKYFQKNEVLKDLVSEIKFSKKPDWPRSFFKIDVTFRYQY